MLFTEFNEKKNDFLLHLEVERNLAPNTQRAYASDLEQFILFWHKLDPQQQTAYTIRQVIDKFLISLFYKKISKSSIARKFSCFKSFEKFLKTCGITLNLKLQRPRPDKKLPVYLSVDEIFHLLDTVADNDLPSKSPIRDKTIFELLYATGIRCSELVAITLKDINMEEKTIRILGKGRKERLVLFGTKAHARLRDYIANERPALQSIHEPLFLNSQRKGLTSRTVQRIIQMFRAFLKVQQPITPHKLRHSFATHMLNQGADLRTVQELLGHSSIASTEKYTHVSLQDLTTMCDTLHPLQSMIKNKK